MRDPTRRNRKIGTAAAGKKRQSPFVIPRRWDSWKSYFENLIDPVAVHRWVHRHELMILVEPTRRGFVHACTPDDIARVLELLPAECIAGPERLRGVVLRQPTRKQDKLNPVWGRLVYSADVGPIDGPAIFLEAQEPRSEWTFEQKLSLERQGELERMQRLASGYEFDGRRHRFRWGLLNLRRWLLYHTLIHEVGHWVDYLSKVVVPSKNGDGVMGELWDRYIARPVAEKEAFAHRFSDEWRDALVRAEQIPFARQFDEKRLRADGLDPEWFRADASGEGAAGPAIGVMFEPPRDPLRVPPIETRAN